MNKKQILILIVILLTLLSGCKRKERKDQLSFSYAKEITIHKNYIANDECFVFDFQEKPQQYEPLIITEPKEIRTITNKINRLDYSKSKFEYPASDCSYIYLIKFDDQQLIINNYRTFDHHYTIRDGDFSFLDELTYVEKEEEE